VISFLNPDVFYMMLIPLILLIVLIFTNKGAIQRYFSKEVLNRLKVNSSHMGKNTRNTLYFVTLILFIVTLSRPVIDKKTQEVKQEIIPIVVAIDVSKSMKANDIYPDRITLALNKLNKLIDISKNSAIGVVLFAKDSFILTPVTFDFISLKYIVSNIDTSLEFTNGSNIYSVIEATTNMLSQYQNKNLIILTDGGNLDDYTKHIELANQNSIDVYTLLTATSSGSPIPLKDNSYLTDKNGNIVTVKANQKIKELCLQSGGGYIEYSLDDKDIELIVDQIEKNSKKDKVKNQKVKIYTELFYYPLGLAIFILFLSLHSIPRKNIGVFILFAISFNTQQLKAFDFQNIEKAKQLYKNEKYKEAAKQYRAISTTPQSLYNLANTQYKQKNYDEAIATYSKVITQDKNLEFNKLYNIANSYVGKNELQSAKEFYEKALKIKEDKDARENIDIVNKELDKQKNKENKDNQKNNKNEEKKDKNKEDKQDKNNNKKDEDKKKGKQEKNQEKGKEKNKKEKDKEKQDESNSKKSAKENNQTVDMNQTAKEIKKDEISNMEEKKWLQMLQKQKTPIFLQKVESKNNLSDDTPW